MSDNERPGPEEGREPSEPAEGRNPSESEDGCEPAKSKHCYKLPSGGSVEFCQWPLLRPLRLVTKTWRDACKRRGWELADDWCVKVVDTKRAILAGSIVIPKGTVVDGASVPLPWLVSFLTFGILRPNGILLIPSIVHDYAYRHGCLPYRGVGNVKISRDDADWLFREMIDGINHTWFWAYAAWLAVRVGWFKVQYNDAPRGGKAPIAELVFVVLALLGLAAALWWVDYVASRCWGDCPWWVIIPAVAFVVVNVLASIASRRPKN